jgi:enoyl-CoA hydratase
VSALVGVERGGDGCSIVTLQRPQALNALSMALRRELAAVFTELAADSRTRVVVLTGAGRAFCAGLDLRELTQSENLAELAVSGAADDPVHAVLAFPGPVIAAINGPAVTGGLELALACDVLIASERATFADTHARVGVLPSWGMSQRLPRLIGRGRALEMSLGGGFIDASRAEAWGLVNRVVPHDELLPAALRLASDMLAAAPGLLAQYKRLIDQGLAGTLQQGLQREAQCAREWAQRIDRTTLGGPAKRFV